MPFQENDVNIYTSVFRLILHYLLIIIRLYQMLHLRIRSTYSYFSIYYNEVDFMCMGVGV